MGLAAQYGRTYRTRGAGGKMSRMASGEAGAAVRVGLLAAAVSALLFVAVQQSTRSQRTAHSGEPAPIAEIVTVDGIPHVDYHGTVGLQANPTTVAEWGLGMVDGSEHILEAAGWLVANQEADGSWRYRFDYKMTGRVGLDAGWPSAIAQGEGLSVLVRAHALTGHRRYADAAEAAVAFLSVPVNDGGVRTTLGGGLWFEEYPTDPPSHVLNGFIGALNGLWQARTLVPGAVELYDEARGTLEANLGRWDLNGEITYDLLHDTLGGPARIDPTYTETHERLLRGLLEQRESPRIRRWVSYWF